MGIFERQLNYNYLYVDSTNYIDRTDLKLNYSEFNIHCGVWYSYWPINLNLRVNQKFVYFIIFWKSFKTIQ